MNQAEFYTQLLNLLIKYQYFLKHNNTLAKKEFDDFIQAVYQSESDYTKQMEILWISQNPILLSSMLMKTIHALLDLNQPIGKNAENNTKYYGEIEGGLWGCVPILVERILDTGLLPALNDASIINPNLNPDGTRKGKQGAEQSSDFKADNSTVELDDGTVFDETENNKRRKLKGPKT